MRKSYIKVFSSIAVILSLALNINGQEIKKGTFSGGEDHSMPAWFKESFLDIADDIEEAKENDKHLMLFLTLKFCPYCTKMLNENFTKGTKNQAFIEKNFDVIGINVKGSKEIAINEDTTLTEKEYAKHLKVQYTPTILFLDSNNNIVVRINGYRSVKNFKHILQYVKTKEYENISLTKYLEKHKDKGLYKIKDNSMFTNTDNLSNINKPLAVIFEDSSCTQCKYLHNTTFKNTDVKKELSKFSIIRLDANSNKEIVTPSGNYTTPKKWAEKLKLDYRPGIILFDDKKEIIRIDALLYSFHFKEVFRFVSGKHYDKYHTFLDYLKVRQANLLDKGIDIDISDK
ncbi:MAG: thioredoxin fold domain-containing protein [Campylobacterota bacterium]|nr:thioredoxin fold domain-containing protein [Campylobacterota bacterium]